uniref:Uncharacterized protein n=1 Tax=Mastacembelus armatus TaxID=205130 RepID=A0A3Q3L584_9TELE
QLSCFHQNCSSGAPQGQYPCEFITVISFYIQYLFHFADSIVIGFWVGLAVFVIFMFFLLTLLTKTGAPHFDGTIHSKVNTICILSRFLVCNSRQPCEKQPCLTGYMDASFNNGALPCQSLPFQCYISKEGQVSSRKLWTSVGSEGRGALGGCYMSASSSLEVGDSTFLQELTVTANATQKEDILLAHFSIPNCVNSEQSSSSGEDSLLLSKQELPTPGQLWGQSGHQPDLFSIRMVLLKYG